MGCVRETPHVNQHWACKRNSPYKPAWGHPRGAPCINQHRSCKTKRNSPCKAERINHHGVCKRKSSLKGKLAQGSSYFLNSSLWSPPSELFCSLVAPATHISCLSLLFFHLQQWCDCAWGCVCVCVHMHEYVCACVCVCLTNIFRDTFVVTFLLVCWRNYCNVVGVCINW